MMSLSIYTSILSMVLVLVLGDSDTSKTDMQPYKPFKVCDPEAIYYGANFLQNKCSYISTPQCFENFAKCAETKKQLKIMDAIDKCSITLRRPAGDMISQACDTTAYVHLTTLQAICCIKTELQKASKKDFPKIEDLLESCYDKENCGSKNCT